MHCVLTRVVSQARSFATNKKPPPPSKGPSGPDSTKPPGAPDRSTASAGGVAAATAGQGARTTVTSCAITVDVELSV